ncbi:MAG: hypothetical protein CMJ64_00830 [Planctomycetaceae bacterium]|nr:hypothetical protein [Planctomycetaceae bacterium]
MPLMSRPESQRKSRKALFVLALVALLGFGLWAAPRRSARLVPADDNITWDAGQPPPQRSIIWRPPEAISGLLPEELKDASVVTPRFSAGGTALYCSVRTSDGQADIHLSRLVAGKWQELAPVAELNTDADELGAVVTSDEQHLYFYSDRDDGIGGFDLYVCVRESEGWSAPRNIGRTINTPAHEYDPAIAADGRTLYFASNRTELMAERAAAAGEDSEQPESKSTIRARRGLTHFDLYAASNNGEGGWNSAEPLVELNQPDSDESSPFMSSDGSHLYFASSRAQREDGKQSLDIYAARRVGSHFRTPENLGAPVNTTADETEPALSPEGFTLVFSSNRGGYDALYTSRPIQVYEEVSWDTSHLAALNEVWGFALLITIGVMFVVAVALRLQGWLAEAATQARFFVASVLFHLALLMVLAFWTLPTVVEIIVSQIQEAEAATQPFDDNQHQSHEDGQQAWEKLADLTTVEKTVDMVRRETEPINIPNETEILEPTIPIEMARLLPSDRVLYTPPNEPAEIQEPRKLTTRTMASPTAPIEVADLAEEIVPETPEAMELTEAAQPVEVGKATTEASVASADTPQVPATARVRPIEFDAAEPSDLPLLDAPLEQAAATRQVSDQVQQVVEITDDEAVPVVPMAEANELPTEAKDEIQLSRATPSRSAPQIAEPAEFLPPRSITPIKETPSADVSDAKPTAPASSLTRAQPMRVEVPDLGATEPPIELDAPSASATELLASADTSVELNRRDVEPPRIEVLTPRELTGPDRGHRRVIVGELSEKRIDLPPSFGPIVSRLDRPRAKAKKVVYAADSVGLREMFTLRQSDIRKQYIELFDGTQESEQAVNHGLVWLITHQNADGSWSLNDFHANCKDKHPNCGGAGTAKSNTAATGLALLPLLASGNTHQSGEYQQQLTAALKWLTDTQKETGDLLAEGDQQRMYSHSIAAIALCEAYGMTQDPELKPAAEKTLDFIVKAQHAATGGWRYNPNEAADTSVVGWAMMALKSGEMAGIPVAQVALDNVAKWLAKVEGNKPVGGTFGYQNANATPAMTAEGLLCLQFMGAGRNDPRMRAGADYLLKNLPEPDQKRTSYYWYYGTQVMYHMQGQYWESWNGRLRDHLVSTQVKDGPLAGTWDPQDNWEKSGGRIYATAAKLLMLEVYYRHLPLYEQLED